MPQSMKVRSLLDDSNRPVLTFHTGPDDYNYGRLHAEGDPGAASNLGGR